MRKILCNCRENKIGEAHLPIHLPFGLHGSFYHHSPVNINKKIEDEKLCSKNPSTQMSNVECSNHEQGIDKLQR